MKSLLALLLILPPGLAAAEAPDLRPRLAEEVAACLAASPDAPGDEACAEAAWEACVARAPAGTAGLEACIGDLLVVWEGELARLWPAAIQGLAPGEARRLAKEHAAWAAWRDALCRQEAAEETAGSLAPLAEPACRTRFAVERVVALRDMARASSP